MLDSKPCAPGSSVLLPLLLKPNSGCPLLSLETAASSLQGPGAPARKVSGAAPAHSAPSSHWVPHAAHECAFSWDFVVPVSFFKTAQVEVWVLHVSSPLTTAPMVPTPQIQTS